MPSDNCLVPTAHALPTPRVYHSIEYKSATKFVKGVATSRQVAIDFVNLMYVATLLTNFVVYAIQTVF